MDDPYEVMIVDNAEDSSEEDQEELSIHDLRSGVSLNICNQQIMIHDLNSEPDYEKQNGNNHEEIFYPVYEED
jgi:hypothetical protein